MKWTYEATYNEALKYKNRKQFRKGNPSAFRSASVNNWIEDYTWFSIKPITHPVWTYEDCYEEAKKYSSIKEFKKAKLGAYTAAYRKDWLKDYTWFVSLRKEGKKWNYETCFEEAKKYTTLKEFIENAKGCYGRAIKKDWVKDYTWLKKGNKGINVKWTYDKCYEAAKKYSSISEFRKNYGGACAAAFKNDWIKDYTWFPSIATPKKKWNYETCFEEAKKYDYKKIFNECAPGAYDAAYKKDWLKDYTWLIKTNVWSYDTCYEEAKKYDTLYKFEKNSYSAFAYAKKENWLKDYTWLKKIEYTDEKIYIIYVYEDRENKKAYVGLTNNLLRRHKEHIKGKKKKGIKIYDVLYNHFKSINKEIPQPIILKDELTAFEAKYYEQYYYNVYKENEWELLNIAQPGSLGGRVKLWDYKTCYEEAKKYSSGSEFRKNSISAYELAKTNDWLKDYTWLSPVSKNILQLENIKLYWTYDKCYEIAKTCKTRMELKKKSYSAYNASVKNKWIDTYTWFVKGKIKWNYETCYNEAKKYKSKIEFKTKNRNVYEVSRANNWLKDFTWLKRPVAFNKKWTYETCYEEAKKYKSKIDFYYGNNTAYKVAYKNKWLEDYKW